jgi:hypothetical protein
VADLEDAVSEFFSGYNLGNGRLRKFYVILTGDDITKQTFWQAFKESSARRSRCAHDGEKGTEPDARASLKACSAFVKHVGGVCTI